MLRWLRKWISRRKEAVNFEAAVVVKEEEGVLTATYPDGSVQSVSWIDLEQIEIHTNDSGPWGADVWWVLTDSKGTCSFPQGATGEAEMLPRFQALSGFDNEQLIEAMGCTSNKKFLCWKRVRPDS